MLNILVVNCDDRLVEYEWNSKEGFVADMDSDNENIPMLDDALAELNTDDAELGAWWEDTECNTVNDLYKECKQKEAEETHELL